METSRLAREEADLQPTSPKGSLVAEALPRSELSVPDASIVVIEVDMTPVTRFYAMQRDSWQAREGVPLSLPLSLPCFVLLATADALRRYPSISGSRSSDDLVPTRNIDMALVMLARHGSSTRTIKNADRLSLVGLDNAVNEPMQATGNRTSTLGDSGGGSFIVNYEGALGALWSIPVVNRPQAASLSAGAIVKRMRVKEDDSIAIRRIMNLCMSFDRHMLESATASQFLRCVRVRLETWPEDAR